MKILGINNLSHDSAVTVIDTESKQIFAMSSERITRHKHDNISVEVIRDEYPEIFEGIDSIGVACRGDVDDHDLDSNTINSPCVGGIISHRVEAIFRKYYDPKYRSEKVPKMKEFYREIKNFKAIYRIGIKNYIFCIISLIRLKYFGDRLKRPNIAKYRKYINCMFSADKMDINFYEHHLCHAFSSYYTSPFCSEKALVLTMDGFGDGLFSCAYVFDGFRYRVVSHSKSLYIAEADTWSKVLSIGVLYGNFTEALGFYPNSDEGKLEALAAYGNNDNHLYKTLIEITVVSDRGISFDINRVKSFYSKSELSKVVDELGKEDVASSVQEWLNLVLVKYVDILLKEHGLKNLCLAGGVAANVIANMHVYNSSLCEGLYICPPMADDGTSLGAALLELHRLEGDISWISTHNASMPYYGNEIPEDEIVEELEKFKSQDLITYSHNDSWQESACVLLMEKKIGALVMGKAEFGPRSLGNRSIIAVTDDDQVQKFINSNIKKRPSFQPFCPSILYEEKDRLFETSYFNKHMTCAFKMKEEHIGKIPASVHVDGTARVQFVNEEVNPHFYKLLKLIKKKTGYGVLINTSYNLHGRTIVRTANDALTDFIDCNLDFLVLGNYLVLPQRKVLS